MGIESSIEQFKKFNTYVLNMEVMGMGRYPEEGEVKKAYALTLNAELVARLQDDCKIQNLSGWVNEQIRKHVLDHRLIFTCVCGCAGSISAWEKWLLICPTCRCDHARQDRRVRTKLEG